MTEAAFGLLALLVLLALFLTGIELAFAMGIIGFLGFAILNGFDPALSLLANDFLDSLASYGLTAIPLFVLMGQIAFNAGIAKELIRHEPQIPGAHSGRTCCGHSDGRHGVQGNLRICRGYFGHLCQCCHSGDGSIWIQQEALHRNSRHRWNTRSSSSAEHNAHRLWNSHAAVDR